MNTIELFEKYQFNTLFQELYFTICQLGGTIVLENGAILHQGVSNDVLFYVLTTDTQNYEREGE